MSEAGQPFPEVVRLFPLPNLVLFPTVVQPLHIFEPRYRAMMADALTDDRMLALVLLQPGWEEDYHNRPPIYPVAVLGRIFDEQLLPDGRFNLMLHGLTRMRIVEELPADKPYRQARVLPLADVPIPSLIETEDLRGRLRDLVPQLIQSEGGTVEQVMQLLDNRELTLGMLCDIFAFALPLEVGFKQQLLEELDVGQRVRSLVAKLEALLPPSRTPRKFPPDFSAN